MKQHIEYIDADVFGMSEIDVGPLSGQYAYAKHQLIDLMQNLGYTYEYYEKP